MTDEASGKKIALFRCTQLILYPRQDNILQVDLLLHKVKSGYQANMSKYVFFESTDEIFQKFDSYEIWPCVLLSPADPIKYDRCEIDDPDIAFWSVYGHLKTGGLECISDHETYDEAKEYMETLPKVPRTPLTPF